MHERNFIRLSQLPVIVGHISRLIGTNKHCLGFVRDELIKQLQALLLRLPLGSYRLRLAKR